MFLAVLRKIESHLEEILCGICLIAMASCIMFQVLLRLLFDSAVPWAEEIAVYSMVFAVYLGASLGVRDRAHIRVLIFVNLLPKSLRSLSLFIADVIWFGFIILMIVESSKYMELLFETTFISPGLGIEQRWFQLVVPISLVMIAFRIVQQYCFPPKLEHKEEFIDG